MLIAWKDEVLKLVLSSPEVADDTAIITGPLSAIASAALAIAGALSVVGSFGISLEPVSSFFTSSFCTTTCSSSELEKAPYRRSRARRSPSRARVYRRQLQHQPERTAEPRSVSCR